MFKRVGVLALALTAGAVFLQPAAFAADRGYERDRGFEHRDTRVVQYREPVRREDFRGYVERDRRVIVEPVRDHLRVPAPVYYVPGCGY